MRRSLAVGLVSALVVASLSVSSPAGGVAGFGDVDTGRFFTEPVQWMVDNEITTGTSPTCFSPDDPVTRGQAAAFMWRMEGFPDAGPVHPFGDVLAPWQQAPVSWMFNNAITTGTSSTTYSPDENLTRGQLAALVHRLEGSPAAPPPIQFPDVIKAWQITPVGWMLQEGITTGTSSTTFSPDDTVTRGQLAAFFYRYKGSPPVVVDPNHPALVPCAGQVDGPATTGEDVQIDKDTTLIQNHNGTFDIIADNVTFDCAGHTITGPGPNVPPFVEGISIESRTGVTVKNCHVTNHNTGISVGDSTGIVLQDNNAYANEQGFAVSRSVATLTNNEGSNNNSWGFFVGEDVAGTKLVGNTANDNGAFGYALDSGGAGVEMTSNHASGNRVGFQDNFTGGSGTAGTDATYSGNTCAGNETPSIPAGLC